MSMVDWDFAWGALGMSRYSCPVGLTVLPGCVVITRCPCMHPCVNALCASCVPGQKVCHSSWCSSGSASSFWCYLCFGQPVQQVKQLLQNYSTPSTQLCCNLQVHDRRIDVCAATLIRHQPQISPSHQSPSAVANLAK